MTFKKILILFVAIEIIIIVLVLISEGDASTALQTIARFSGRISLFLFSAIFILYGRPLTITAWLSDKFYSLFAVVHGIHLAALLLFVYTAEINLIPYRVAGGVFAYLLIFSMPFVQYYKETGRISTKAYAILETIFIYYIWLIFFLTYLPRVQGKLSQAGGSFAEHVALLGWISTLLGMKVASLIQFQMKKK